MSEVYMLVTDGITVTLPSPEEVPFDQITIINNGSAPVVVKSGGKKFTLSEQDTWTVEPHDQ